MSEFDAAALTPPLHVPRLPAGPVLLRPFALGDLALVREAAGDPGIVSISSVPHPYSDDAGRDFIRRQHRRANAGDGYSFVIAGDAVDGPRAVGSIGLWLREVEVAHCRGK